MIKIFIQGMKDGLRDVIVESPVEEMPLMFPEFFGVIKLTGSLRRIGRRFSFTGVAGCDAKLNCDRSLTDYVERITAEIKVSFLAENLHQNSVPGLENLENESTIIIGDDEKYLDLSEVVSEELAVNLPLKRIAPEYRDKEFDEIYPQYSPKKVVKREKNEIDDRWSVLKNVKLNSLNN